MVPGQIGTGVSATEITRQYDEFVTKQVIEQNSDTEFWSAQYKAMEEIESIFTENEESGINYLLGQFWNAWSDLSDNPDGTAEREALIAQSENLVQAITDIDYNLRSYQRYLNNAIQGAVETVNSLTSQIADLNGKITSVEIDGSVNANDLRDTRDKLLLELSSYVDISYYEEEQSGQVMVYILGGTPLVMGLSSYSLTNQYNNQTGNTDVLWQDSSGREVNITDDLDGGKIAGWIETRDNRIGQYLDTFNTFAGELIYQVNDLHSLGVGLESVSSMTGTETIEDPDVALDATDVDGNYLYAFGSRFESGSFDIVTYDDSGNVVGTDTVTLAAGATVTDLISEINGITNMNASLDSENHLVISADSGYTFAMTSASSGDSNNHALAILGVNTYFSWSAEDGDFTETIGINSALVDDVSLIAAGRLDSNNLVAEGDNQNALAIYDLQDEVLEIDGSSTTLNAYYSALISTVGVHAQNAEMNASYSETLLTEYSATKESISGVNLDEEMADLLMFQRAYQAASKLITTADEMLQTLLSMKQ
jgi:flagellar hook-associated protein 1 FlgK